MSCNIKGFTHTVDESVIIFSRLIGRLPFEGRRIDFVPCVREVPSTKVLGMGQHIGRRALQV